MTVYRQQLFKSTQNLLEVLVGVAAAVDPRRPFLLKSYDTHVSTSPVAVVTDLISRLCTSRV